MGRHNVKVGFRWVRQAGSRTNPQNAEFRYLTKADLLANIPNQVAFPAGQPPYDSHLDESGGFIQDDWRVNNKIVLNLGLRYDYYATVKAWPTTDVPAEIVNLEPPTDLRKMDFGALRDPLKPYEPDAVNFGPRAGFAWTMDEKSEMVVRGGVGFLFSPHPACNCSRRFAPVRTLPHVEPDGGGRQRSEVAHVRCGPA
jgi:outer membrane receptor protein involved in Fe transport